MRKINLRFGILLTLIFTLGMIRLIPHYPNFTPVGAMALMGGAYFSKRWQAFLLPLGSLFISDIAINYIVYQKLTLLHSMWLGVYGSFSLIVCLGLILLNKVNIKNVVFSSLLASMIFFFVSNFGV